MIKTISYKGHSVMVTDDGKYVWVDGKLRKQFLCKPKRSTKGFKQVYLGNKNSKAYVHRLVALAFIDNPDNLPYACHRDSDTLNNKAENIVWGTSLDTDLYMKLSGRENPRRTAQFIKSDKDFDIVIELLRKGVSMTTIAKLYNTSDMSIHRFKVRNKKLIYGEK